MPGVGGGAAAASSACAGGGSGGGIGGSSSSSGTGGGALHGTSATVMPKKNNAEGEASIALVGVHSEYPKYTEEKVKEGSTKSAVGFRCDRFS